MERYNTIVQALPNTFNVWTDGSCWHVDRGGAFAYIVEGPDGVILDTYAQAVSDTTVSRMELTAALRALESFKTRSVVQLITDSEYLAKGLVFFMDGWRSSGWRIKNADLWKNLYDVYHFHDVYVTKILGHSGEKNNEYVDKLASNTRKKLL